MAGTPLPRLSDPDLRVLHDPDHISAYDVCLAFEGRSLKGDRKDNIVHARLLGYLIIHAPNTLARHEVVKVIHSYSQNDRNLSDLGDVFKDYFVRCFKKYKERTPTPRSHPSRPSPDVTKERLLAAMIEAPRDYREAKRQALIRDGFRCVITGKYDFSAEHVPMEERIRAGGVHTQLGHVMPESTCFDVETSKSPERDYAAAVFAVLSQFGYDVGRLKGDKIHLLYNVMTFQSDVHDCFNRLELWFERTDIPNCYNIKTVMPGLLMPEQATGVTLTTPDPAHLPLPDPNLLALHAACAKVAHLSGAGEHVDRIFRDIEEIGVLAEDGGSAEVLYQALLTGGSRAVSIGA